MLLIGKKQDKQDIRICISCSQPSHGCACSHHQAPPCGPFCNQLKSFVLLFTSTFCKCQCFIVAFIFVPVLQAEEPLLTLFSIYAHSVSQYHFMLAMLPLLLRQRSQIYACLFCVARPLKSVLCRGSGQVAAFCPPQEAGILEYCCRALQACGPE